MADDNIGTFEDRAMGGLALVGVAGISVVLERFD